MELKNIGEKDLVISLIKDDLINARLVEGLRKMEMYDADHYYIYASETAFQILGFTDSRRDEKVYEKYLEYRQKVMDISVVENSEKIDRLALDIYVWLLEKSIERRKRILKKQSKKKKHGNKKNH